MDEGRSPGPPLISQPLTWLQLAKLGSSSAGDIHFTHCCSPEALKAQHGWKLQRASQRADTKCQQPVTLWVHHEDWGSLHAFHSWCNSLQILPYAGMFLFPSIYDSNEGNEFLPIMVLMNLKGKKKRDVISEK